MPTTGDLRDPDWEPSESEHDALMEDFRLVVLWRKAMVNQGIAVLAFTFASMAEEVLAARRWWRDEGKGLHADAAERG